MERIIRRLTDQGLIALVTMTSVVPLTRRFIIYSITYYFKHNMFITPSGMYFEDDLEFCLKKVGAERIMWATDYPYRINDNAKEFLENLDLEEGDLEKIAYKNAEKLFGLS